LSVPKIAGHCLISFYIFKKKKKKKKKRVVTLIIKNL